MKLLLIVVLLIASCLAQLLLKPQEQELLKRYPEIEENLSPEQIDEVFLQLRGRNGTMCAPCIMVFFTSVNSLQVGFAGKK
jgi:hypothetical protein